MSAATVTTAAEAEPAANTLERLVERAITAGAGREQAQVQKVTRKHPDTGPADVVALLEQR